MLPLHDQVNEIFHNEDPEIALEDAIDRTLRGSYPLEDVYKVSLILIKYIYLNVNLQLCYLPYVGG